jgi:hypothetical protein
LLAEVDFPPYRFQQELLPGNVGVLVEVMADALDQPVDWRHEVGSGGRNTVIRIDSDHQLLSPCQAIGLVKILGEDRPGLLVDFPKQPPCQGGESGVFRGRNRWKDTQSGMGVADFLSAW